MALTEVLERIRRAETEAGRPSESVNLVAVSKQQPIERVRAALESGHRRFGENRVQEAQSKWPALRAEFSDLTLHLLGPLQTNKVKAAVTLFDVIESVDRDRLAVKLAEESQAQGRAPSLFIQVNTGEEAQKAGISPAETDAFVNQCLRVYDLPIIGLMAIPPADEPPAPHFALLAKLADRNGLSQVSMGMSADFEIAISLGATSVRVGSAVFGARPKVETASPAENEP